MSDIASQEKATSLASPLDSLSDSLTDDMREVNAAILKEMQSDVPMIPQLAGYLIAAGGKRIRPLMTLAGTLLFEGDMKRAHGLSAAVEFIHTATLLHDDVVDESDERRGQKAANLIFGNKSSVLVGDYLFSKAFQLMVADGSLEILRILSDASAIIAEGEVMQLGTANNIETSLDEYLAVIKAKTAALFAASCEVGPVIAGADAQTQKSMHDYGMALGIAFQIDDILDYKADQEALGKTIGDDFREGKMTAPVIFALENADELETLFWQRTIQDKNQKEGDFESALEILEKHDAVAQSFALAQTYVSMAENALPAAKNSVMQEILRSLASFTLKRAF